MKHRATKQQEALVALAQASREQRAREAKLDQMFDQVQVAKDVREHEVVGYATRVTRE